MASIKAQQAVEYLTTYGWALLILLAAVAALFWVGVINPKVAYSSACLFPADFSCSGAVLNTTGNYSLFIGQATGHPINVTKLRCTQEENFALGAGDGLPAQITMQNGGSARFSGQCFEVNAEGEAEAAAGIAGDVFKGRVYVEYVELDTGFTHQVAGDVTLKFEEVVVE